MSLPFTTNRLLTVNIKGDDNIVSDLNGNVSLLCNGKVALYGNTTLSEGKVLAIGKSPQSATYPLDVSGNIQYSGNVYKAGVIQDKQDDNNIQVLDASAIVILNKNFVYHGINNNTITTIRLPNESTLTVGHRFVIFPMQNWAGLATTVTVNCESVAQILDVSAGTGAVQMSSNNPYVEFICIATTGTVRWATINRDPQALLGRSNTFTGSNTFASGIQLQTDMSTNLLKNIIANGITVTPGLVAFLSFVNFDASANVSIWKNSSLAGVNNVSLGYNALKNVTGNNNTAIGTDALSISSVAGYSDNTAAGYQAGIVCQSNYCTYIGANSGVGHNLVGGDYCTFLGASAGSDGSGNWNQSTAIGYLSKITASNQIMLGRSTDNVVCPGTLQVNNNYIANARTTIITDASNATLSGVLFRYYSVTSASAYSITLPAAAIGYLGCTVTFVRVGANPANAITSASSNIFPVNSLTSTTTLLDANVYQITICCMVISSAPTTYGWVVI